MFKLFIRTAVLLLLSTTAAQTQAPDIEWVKAIYGTSPNAPLGAFFTDMCTDADGNTYYTGEFRNDLKFGTLTLTGSSEAALFLAKYSPGGTPLWAVKVAANAPTTFSAFTYSAKVDADGIGNVHLSANYEAASLDFGNGTTLNRTCTDNCREGFLARFNGAGVVQFVKGLHAAAGQDFKVAGVAAAPDGTHYLAGSFTGTEAWLQGGANIGGITKDAFYLVQYNPSGGGVWTALLPDNSGDPDATAIAVSPDGERIAVMGRYTDPQLYFGNMAYASSNSNSKQFVVWYNKTGQPLGAGTIGAASIEVFDFSVTADYRVWAACDFSGDLTWNDANIASINGTNSRAALVSVASGQPGQLVSAIGFNGNSYPLNTFAVSPDGKFYTGGTSRETITVAGSTLDFQGCADLLLSGGSGTSTTWGKTIGGAGCEIIQNDYYGSLMDTDADGNLYVCGHFENGASAGGNSIPGNGLWLAKFSAGPVSVQDNVLTDNQLLLSPNPANGLVQVSAPGFSAGSWISIYNCLGKRIAENQVDGENITFNIAGWQPGIYFAVLADAKGAMVQSAKLLVE